MRIFLYLYTVFVGQLFYCLVKIKIVISLYKSNHISGSSAASEAGEYLFLRRHDKRRSLLVVERTQSFIVGSRSLKLYASSYDIYYINLIF